jgi:hypothetical protein
MNNFSRNLFQLIVAFVLILMLASCGGGFLNTKPEDSISLSNFYSSDKQVEASTNILYGAPWFLFNTKFMWAIGDMMSGNGRSYSGDVEAFGNFSITADNPQLLNGWESLWTVVAQANSLINNLPKDVSSNVDQAAINQALGEAHVMRAAAYFYLVRIWGAVPIIQDNLKYVYSPQVPRNRGQDVYQFIENDLEYGIKHCKKVASGLYDGGHVTSGSAKALLSKVYLVRKNYKKARQLSEEVINGGEFHLLDNYSNLFKTQYNNNPETIIALQWSDNGYGTGNAIQSSFAYQTKLTGVGTGYAVLGPTIGLQRAFKKSDKRLKPTIMLAGFHYSDLLSNQGGYTVPKNVNAQGTDAAVKKYVVGTPADNGGVGTAFSTEINTYILRYADVLLIHTEAILAPDGNFNKSTSNSAALKSFNKVRERAGLSPKSSITMKDILHARRLEFAFEGQYWYALKRIKRSKAIQILSQQERGVFLNVPRQNPPQIYNPGFTVFPSDQFDMPYPAADVEVNKYLRKDHPPQKYNFNKNNSQ